MDGQPVDNDELGDEPELPSATPTVDAIYAAYERAERARGPGGRLHLGASEIGRPCERELWLRFRWAQQVVPSGRMLRLYASGHIEEQRVIADLRAAGMRVDDKDPATGRQFGFFEHAGHFAGSCDGKVLGLLEAPKRWHLLEIKTHNLKSYAKLVRYGVKRAKPEHYDQMQIYMAKLKLKRAAYFAVCKDSDEMHMERVYPDPERVQALVARAARVVFAARPPARISEDPSWWQCRFCDFRSLCHAGAVKEQVIWPLRTCRSCIHSTPLGKPGEASERSDGAGRWSCAKVGELPEEVQRHGCKAWHRFIPEMVQGEQVDADPEGELVEYRLKTGEMWTDAGQDMMTSTEIMNDDDPGAAEATGPDPGHAGLGP